MKRAAIAGVFLIVWGAGLSTLAPAYPHGDSGETAGVALFLGIAHPPGYPLPTMLGNLFVKWFPAGSVAWRVSLLSLASAAGAACLLAGAVSASFRSLPPHLLLLVGVTGGLSLEVWNQMTLPKGSVYTVTVLFLGAVICLLARMRDAADGEPEGTGFRRLAGAGLALGLALGGHYPMVAPFVPFLLVPVVADLRRRAGGGRAFLMATVFCAVSASVYLYLPLRTSSAHPMFRWAEPETARRFSWLVLREQYMFLEKQSREGNGRLLAMRFGRRFVAGFGPAGVLLLGIGLAAAVSRRRWWVLAVAAGGAAEISAAAFYPKLEADALWVADPFSTAGWYALALVTAWGAAHVAGWPGRRWRAAAAGILLAAAAWEVRAGYVTVSKRWNYYAVDQQANLAATLPRDALVFCEGDAYIAPLLYGLYVDGQRPDIRMIIPIFLHQNLPWGLEQLAEQYPDLQLGSLKPTDHVWLKARDIMESHLRRPWTYTLTTSKEWPFGRFANPLGLVYLIRGEEDTVADGAVDRAMVRYRLRDTMKDRIFREPFERIVRDNYVKAYFSRGIYRRVKGEHAVALAHFNRARRLGSPEAALNAGLHYFEEGDVGRAEKCWRQARELAPDRPEAYVNLALVALSRPPRDADRAIGLCEKAIELKPDFAKAHEILANAWYMKGELPRAVDSLRKAVALNPKAAGLRDLLDKLTRDGR